MGRNTVEIWTTAPLPYLLIILKAIQVERITVSDMQHVRTLLLSHWLLMTSSVFFTVAIYCNMFRRNYLRNKKLFLDFFLHFLNLNSILNILKKNKKKWLSQLVYFWAYGLRKTWLHKRLKSAVSENSSTCNIVN